MMILIALEENMAEYKAIREDLDKMFDVICELNVQDKQPGTGGSEVSTGMTYLQCNGVKLVMLNIIK